VAAKVSHFATSSSRKSLNRQENRRIQPSVLSSQEIMAEKITVYEKPTCTKCRQVKSTLNEQGVAYEAINYFEHPLTADQLKKLFKAANLASHEALRKNESAYKEHIAGRELNDDQIINLMVKHPELIQRPIVVKGSRAVIARPVEKLKDLGL
jgi:arsenate reductase